MVVIFLYTIAHNHKNRVLQKRFGRSGETISRHIHRVLRAILRLAPILLCEPQHVSESCCLGAIDGTHIKVCAKMVDQAMYRDKDGDLSMSVLGVVNPNMEFIYCLAGWEGSAHDTRVLHDALTSVKVTFLRIQI
ncbi:Protein ALP1-like [Linum grandiflorum]